jgi:hypothetical protein
MTTGLGIERRFCVVGDGRYTLTIEIGGAEAIQLTADRVRSERHELICQLAVACLLPGARTVDGFLSVADFNLSSAQARATRAKLLAERSESYDLDWPGFVEELCVRTIAAERQGTPAKLLHTFRRRDPDEDETYDVHGWPWLRDEPMITFADGGGLKTYLLDYGLGLLSQRGVRVGLVDWELSGERHVDRLARLFPEPLPEIHYIRCDRPLTAEVDRVQREVRRLDLDYVGFDSAGFGTNGAPESAEEALAYFRAVRQIGVGSHHLAHVNKSETSEQKPFGSSFWHNSARATWFAKQADPGLDSDRRVVGLYNRKSNLTKLYPSIGFQFDFSQAGVTTITRVNLEDVEELAAQLPLWQRIKQVLLSGGGFPLSVGEIAERLGEKPASIQRAVSPSRARKGGSMFTQIPGSDGKPRIALVDRRSA